MGTFSNCITTYSENKDVAKDYIRFCHQKEVYEKFFVTNKGYINGPLPEWQQHPMWDADPAVTIFRELPKYGRSSGYAGPYNRQAAEVWAKYIIVDLFAKVVQGESPQSCHRLGRARAEERLRTGLERSHCSLLWETA